MRCRLCKSAGSTSALWTAQVRAVAACFVIGITLPVFATEEKACRSIPSVIADGRPRVQTTPYENIKPTNLAAVYRAAYVKAGFKFKGKTNIGNYGSFRLAFEFEVPGFNRKGIATIVFGVRLTQDGTCAPCEVHRETMGIPWKFDKDYDAQKLRKAELVVFAADAQANARINEKLGSSLGSLLDHDRSPVRDEPC